MSSGVTCGDNRFEIIEKAKKHIIEATNIQTSEDEMKVLDTFLFRCWQMGWLKRYEQPQADKWIPCEERLPIGEEYRKRIDGIWYYKFMLTATNDSDIPIQVGWYSQEDECWYDQDGFVFRPVAWQPLPTPYKKEGAEDE